MPGTERADVHLCRSVVLDGCPGISNAALGMLSRYVRRPLAGGTPGGPGGDRHESRHQSGWDSEVSDDGGGLPSLSLQERQPPGIEVSKRGRSSGFRVSGFRFWRCLEMFGKSKLCAPDW